MNPTINKDLKKQLKKEKKSARRMKRKEEAVGDADMGAETAEPTADIDSLPQTSLDVEVPDFDPNADYDFARDFHQPSSRV